MAAAADHGNRGARDRRGVCRSCLQDYLTIFATRVLILCAVRALVRSGVGLCRNHELRAGAVLWLGRLRRGADRARSRHHVDLARAAGGHLDRVRIRVAARRLPAAGTASVQRHLRCAGHADRILCRRSAGAGLVLSRRPERHPVDPVHDARAATISTKGRCSIISRSAFSSLVYLLCRFLVRSQFGLALAGLRENEQRIAFFGYRGAASEGDHLLDSRAPSPGLPAASMRFTRASSGRTCWAW